MAQSLPDSPPARAHWVLALHGGAGRIPPDLKQLERDALDHSLRQALTAGKDVLANGGSALDAVERVVTTMEDDSRFNAGRGAVFTRNGTHELDASIMDGTSLRCGAVAVLKFHKSPVKLARLVMDRSPHVLLVGEGADAFADELGMERVGQQYFYTERRFRELQELLQKHGLTPPTKPAYDVPQHRNEDAGPPTKGTVGCVALDSKGNLAAATSTGGMTGKLPGRVGDTPIIGAGTYANRFCAVSCTGNGEEFIRHSIAFRIVSSVEEHRLGVDEAVKHCLTSVLRPDDGGIIAIDRKGAVSMRSTTGAMPRGVADFTGRFETAIWFEADGEGPASDH